LGTCQRLPLSLYSRSLTKLRPTVHPDIGIHSGLKFRVGTSHLSPQGEAMVDLNNGFINKPDDGLGYSRAFCLAVGKLEKFGRGNRVLAWYAGTYRTGKFGARIPGGLYWLELESRSSIISRLMLRCENFGGRVND